MAKENSSKRPQRIDRAQEKIKRVAREVNQENKKTSDNIKRWLGGGKNK